MLFQLEVDPLGKYDAWMDLPEDSDAPAEDLFHEGRHERLDNS